MAEPCLWWVETTPRNQGRPGFSRAQLVAGSTLSMALVRNVIYFYKCGFAPDRIKTMSDRFDFSGRAGSWTGRSRADECATSLRRRRCVFRYPGWPGRFRPGWRRRSPGGSRGAARRVRKSEAGVGARAHRHGRPTARAGSFPAGSARGPAFGAFSFRSRFGQPVLCELRHAQDPGHRRSANRAVRSVGSSGRSNPRQNRPSGRRRPRYQGAVVRPCSWHDLRPG